MTSSAPRVVAAMTFLKDPAACPEGPIVALVGDEAFLKREVLQALLRHDLGDAAGEEDGEPTRLQGKTADLTAVLDELRTVSMFGERRVVVVEEADEFVKLHRASLERYLERPAGAGKLVLDVKSWPVTTRLAKKTLEIGLTIDCQPLKPKELPRWVQERAAALYRKKISREGVELLLDLAGTELGLLDQELAKLTAYVGDAATIDVTAVQKLVGGWRMETTWTMLDALRGGDLPTAWALLDRLLVGGEHPLKLLGGINWAFRPLAQATEAAREGVPLRTALEQAGVKPMQLDAAGQYLRRIGRPRAERLRRWLEEVDVGVKGGNPLPERIQMERLLLRLAGRGESEG